MGGKNIGLSDYELTTAKKQTKREKFLSETEVVVPWQPLLNLIEPHYPKTSKKGGRPPYPLATMLRIHLLKQWYSLSDLAMEKALIEVSTMRRFTGIKLISDQIPDETTIQAFHHLLEIQVLGDQTHCCAGDFFYKTVKAHLSATCLTSPRLLSGSMAMRRLLTAMLATEHSQEAREGRGCGGVSGGDAAQQPPRLAGHARRKNAGLDRDRQGPHAPKD